MRPPRLQDYLVQWKYPMSDFASAIPAHLLDRLREYKPALEVNGTVLCRREKRRHRAFRIRFRAEYADYGYRKHFALPIGKDPTVAKAVRSLLTQWQCEYQGKLLAEKNAKLAQEEGAKKARRAQRLEERWMKEGIRIMASGGRDPKRAAVREFDRALKQGPIASTLYVLSKSYLNPPKYKAKVPTPAAKVPVWEPVAVQEEVRGSFSRRRQEMQV